MPLTPEDWHQRYLEQAQWTSSLREYLFRKSDLTGARRVLDVGCGTGALELDFSLNIDFFPIGIDIDRTALNLARKNVLGFTAIQGNAQELPFDSGVFEISFCHFVLLWVKSPAHVVREMARVTKPGGAVIAIAEPDYGGRIDYPEELGQIGRWQFYALQKQGADPITGRRLLGLFNKSGLSEVEVGVIGSQWTGDPSLADFQSEWKIIEADLETLNLPPSGKAHLLQLKKQDTAAQSDGSRVLYVPTFYAWGKVPR